jgi:hypothetical protein
VMRSLRATGADYSRLVAMFRWPALVGGVILLVLAVVVLAQGPSEVRTVGPVALGSPVTSTLSGSVNADVFVSLDGAGDTECRDASGALVSTLRFPIPADRTIEGQAWFGTAAQVEVRPGDAVTCSVEGADRGQVLLVHRTGLVRMLQAALFGVLGLLGLAFWLIGSRAARRAGESVS